MRSSITIIVATIKNKLSVHFTRSDLAGSDNNLWIPLKKTTSCDHVDFSEIEEIMVCYGIAHNCTLIKNLNRGQVGKYAEYEVSYNIALASNELNEGMSLAFA